MTYRDEIKKERSTRSGENGGANDDGTNSGEKAAAEETGTGGSAFEVAAEASAVQNAAGSLSDGAGVHGGRRVSVGNSHVVGSDGDIDHGGHADGVLAHPARGAAGGETLELVPEEAGPAGERPGLVSAVDADLSSVGAALGAVAGLGGVHGHSFAFADLGAGGVAGALAWGLALAGRRAGAGSRSRSGGDRVVGCEVNPILGVVFADLLAVVGLGSEGACGHALELCPLPAYRADEAPLLAVVGDAVSTVRYVAALGRVGGGHRGGGGHGGGGGNDHGGGGGVGHGGGGGLAARGVGGVHHGGGGVHHGGGGVHHRGGGVHHGGGGVHHGGGGVHHGGGGVHHGGGGVLHRGVGLAFGGVGDASCWFADVLAGVGLGALGALGVAGEVAEEVALRADLAVIVGADGRAHRAAFGAARGGARVRGLAFGGRVHRGGTGRRVWWGGAGRRVWRGGADRCVDCRVDDCRIDRCVGAHRSVADRRVDCRVDDCRIDRCVGAHRSVADRRVDDRRVDVHRSACCGHCEERKKN